MFNLDFKSTTVWLPNGSTIKISKPPDSKLETITDLKVAGQVIMLSFPLFLFFGRVKVSCLTFSGFPYPISE
jgi:hypothetical protein